MSDPTVREVRAGDFVFTYADNVRIEPYSCPDYSGVIFFEEDGSKYDVVINPYFGPRLLFNNKKRGMCHDIPFKEATFEFLPSGVKARLEPR